ncbi:MAG: hypothetical protein KKA32_06340 [Actinobacteria bacterium]|nr:hypothetical protein [Actinomycetota bacterium]
MAAQTGDASGVTGADDKLKEYREKRDFARTAEPSGGAIEPSEERRLFCVQKHAATALHYDLRLEIDGVLKSWAVPKGPSLDPADKRLAVMTEDHPLDYGDFEGVISAGEYGGGAVVLWDTGWWEQDHGREKRPREGGPSTPAEHLAAGELKFILHGEKLNGSWTLVHMKGRGDKNWLLIKHRDETSRPGYDLVIEAPLSVLSGRGIEEVLEGGAPQREHDTPFGGAPDEGVPSGGAPAAAAGPASDDAG